MDERGDKMDEDNRIDAARGVPAETDAEGTDQAVIEEIEPLDERIRKAGI